jgi:hypothetical protein
VHRVTAQLPSNYSAKYIHYRFTLMPGDVTSDVTVMPADFGSGLRIETQPSNAAISADGSAADGTTTLRAKASGRSDTVQWYSATVAGHWSPVKGATRRTLVVSAAAMSAFDVQYVATFTHGEASATSRPASVYEITYGQRWSGYVDVAGGARRFDAVSGTWRVPATTCSAATSYQADWVGIDGQSNNTTEQAGTEENCYHGTASYVAFYYLWGYANFHRGVPVLLPSSSDPIAPHDKLSVSVSLVKEEWTFTFDDATAGWKATIPVAQRNPPPEQASAEWIVEAPQICATNCVTAALAATASVTFTKARATLSGVTGTINSWPTQGFDIAKGFKALNAVSPLNSAGTSFTVTPTRGSG